MADGVVHLTGAGSCNLTASQGGDDVYFAAPNVTRMFAVEKASQTIDFSSLEGRTWGDPDFDVAASASSGLPVVFSATGSCTVAGRTIRLSDVGGCSVTASQRGDGDYEPAADVTQTFVVAWPFTGFLAPLRGDDIIEAKAGSTVPLKFSLGGAWGLTSWRPVLPGLCRWRVRRLLLGTAVLPADASGSSRLSFEDGVYHYGWKTEAGWAGTCRELVVELRDTTVHAVTFAASGDDEAAARPSAGRAAAPWRRHSVRPGQLCAALAGSESPDLGDDVVDVGANRARRSSQRSSSSPR